jgi:hypothetical protein
MVEIECKSSFYDLSGSYGCPGKESLPYPIMRWWTTKGDYATKLREYEEKSLRTYIRKRGNILILYL